MYRLTEYAHSRLFQVAEPDPDEAMVNVDESRTSEGDETLQQTVVEVVSTLPTPVVAPPAPAVADATMSDSEVTLNAQVSSPGKFARSISESRMDVTTYENDLYKLPHQSTPMPGKLRRGRPRKVPGTPPISPDVRKLSLGDTLRHPTDRNPSTPRPSPLAVQTRRSGRVSKKPDRHGENIYDKI